MSYTAPTIAAHNFSDGTFGPFRNSWTQYDKSLVVVADPTVRAQGNVAKIIYGQPANNPPGGGNLALFVSSNFNIDFGEDWWFLGDLYLETPTGTSEPQRKLIYGNYDPNADFILSSWGASPGPTNLVTVGTSWISGAHLYFDRWHRLRGHVQMNSGPSAADGWLDLWIDGTLYPRVNGLKIISTAGWTLPNVGFGYQVNAVQAEPWTENRYWDNLALSREEIDPDLYLEGAEEMATFTKLYAFIEAVYEKKHNLGSDQLMVALTNTAPNVTTHTKLADLTEISYTNLSSRVVTVTSSGQSGGLYKLICADLVLTASGAVGPFQYVYLYNNTATDKDLIGVWDRGAAVTLANGETFTIDFDQTNGVLQDS